VPAPDLAAWIAELRRRLEAGELAGRAPVEIGPGETLADVERGVRALLRDVDYFASLSPQEKRLPHFVARREKLARNLLAMREALKPKGW
jgi:hypothetical protein